jgi:predicted acylesterase/phospholipase RssA
MHNQIRSDLLRIVIPERDHLGEFITRIDMEQRKRNFSREKRLLRKSQHHAGVLANGIQHHRMRELRNRFTQNVKALRFQRLKMIQPFLMVLRDTFALQTIYDQVTSIAAPLGSVCRRSCCLGKRQLGGNEIDRKP